MGKYLIGNCKGCGNLTAAAVVSGDGDIDMEHAMQFIESGHVVKTIETDRDIGVERCVCDD